MGSVFSVLKNKPTSVNKMTCEVCMENFTTAIRRKIDCSFCDYSACSQCHQRYLLSSSEYAHCMSCRKGWPREILHREFTDAFVNKTYKQHRENVLYDRERSLMPETQPYVEIERRVLGYISQRVNMDKERNRLTGLIHQQASADLNLMGKETWDDARIERQRRVVDLTKQVTNLTHDMAFMDYATNVIRNTNPADVEKRKFVRACPANGCRGFLSTAWKCGLCDSKVCSKCHEIKGENEDEHMCDPNNVATAEMLSKDSKTCPQCAAMIFKIAGCDQMYCTQCHTAFSWRTGRVEQGVIHNPHYYDYMRRNGTLQRNPGDVVCGGLPNITVLHSVARLPVYTEQQRTWLWNLHQNLQHIQHGGVAHRYRATNIQEGRDLRIKFMLGTLSEEDFKRKLQQREKSENKKREIREVLEMYTTVCTDIIQRVIQTPQVNLLPEIGAIRQHTEQLFTSIASRWKCAVPKFSEPYGLVH